ncbi:small integral membrane protein 4 [Bombus terrestris]|uniref:Small integral membrane protein 4 n=1 Tax=Bombus terrestris TaxID=30195 RepID=A0A9B7CYF9_BOMTE|nr:small integral membrane protein 4 [Bombus terrestris]
MQLRRIRQLDTESTRWRQSYGRSGSVRCTVKMPILPKFNIKRTIRRTLNKMPGKSLGEFRFLPIMFLMGGLLEFVMIHWHVGEVNFYRTYKRRRIEEAVEQRLAEMNAQVNK